MPAKARAGRFQFRARVSRRTHLQHNRHERLQPRNAEALKKLEAVFLNKAGTLTE